LLSASFEGDNIVEDSPETTERYGMLAVIKSSLDLVTLPLMGGLSDYLGRKKVLFGCLISIFLQILLIYPPGVGFIGVDNYYKMLIASRFLSGVSDGVLVMVFAR
jgi:MFS family permease